MNQSQIPKPIRFILGTKNRNKFCIQPRDRIVLLVRHATVIAVFLLCFVVQTEFLAAQQLRLTDKLAGEDLSALAAEVTRFGDPVRGAIAFFRPEMNCAKCHEPGSRGRRLGPDLAERREFTIEKLADSILHPSAEIREGFETTLLMLDDGRQISGIVVDESETEIRIDRIEETSEPLVISQSEIEDRKKTKLSTMPEALANQLADRSEFLDLVRYVEEIARGGPARAAQLLPTTSMAASAPLPEYESRVDHRGLIESMDRKMLSQGAEIFRLRCASCHGALEGEGSMPTSLRFPTGQFKRGNDPYTLYQTLTHGFGMMNSQRWMVPQQKYAVIHYLRETFLKRHNPTQYFAVTEQYLTGLPAGDTRGPKPVESTPWTLMDYGPSLINTIEISRDGSNIAQKGITIRLDDGPGGVESGSHWMIYDHDTMRMAGAWSGGFIDYNGIHFNGVHNQHPKIAGPVHLKNPTGPGWGSPGGGSFDDNRFIGRDNKRYGPLDRNWAQYRGMYRYGKQTVIRYTVGDTEILESPALKFAEGRPVFIRTLNIGPRSQEMTLQVASESKPFAYKCDSMISLDDSTTRTISQPTSAFDGNSFYQIELDNVLDTSSQDFSIAARIKTESDGTIVCKTVDEERWVANGQSLFVHAGKLAFDVGWVGAVRSNVRVADGKWHDVVLTWQAKETDVRFFVDGKPAGGGKLAVKKPLAGSVIRIGATNENFPESSFFNGEIENVRLYQRMVSPGEVRPAGSIGDEGLVADWTQLVGGDVPAQINPALIARRIGNQPVISNPVGLVVSAMMGNAVVNPDAWLASDDGNLRLRIPAGDQALKLNVLAASIDAAEQIDLLCETIGKIPAPADLEPLTHGGPPNWPQVLETDIVIGDDNSPYAVDVLTHPANNPWNCRLRTTGVDFIPGEDAAMVCTWDGGVWKVTGIGQTEPGSKLHWRRIATGLFQPLGIKLRDGVIFVTCRDQLVALHDLNGDGEMDWYECYNNDHQVTEHFHEFAMGLQIDAEGNFYYAKSARHALPALVPHHGALLKISADGQRTEIIANGFRAANGVCLNPDGSFVVTDQEGHWNPKNRINWVTPGGFYGNMFGYHDVTDSSDEAMEPPLCWITNSFDRSPAELMWVDSDRWGPLAGSLLNFSYGYGKIYVVPHENIEGQMQGGMCAFDLPQFPTGIMRGRFNPVDGQLYCCGMFAWSSTQEQPGGLYRIRYTGKAVPLPIGLHALDTGVEIEFSGAIDPNSVTDPANFAIQAWDLKRTANYGSDHYNERRWAVTSARLLPDGKTVSLAIPDIAPTWGMEIVYAIRAADGKPLQGKIHNTIHHLRKTNESGTKE